MRRPAAHHVVAAAALEFQVGREALLTRDRRPNVAAARQVAMYLLREHTLLSLPEIGRVLGGRNHTTALQAWRRVGAAVDSEPKLRRAVARIRRALQGLDARAVAVPAVAPAGALRMPRRGRQARRAAKRGGTRAGPDDDGDPEPAGPPPRPRRRNDAGCHR